MVNVVTRSRLCLGKARVRPDRAQGQGPAIQLRALDPWNLCLKTSLVWWVASLQEAELQGHARVAGKSFDINKVLKTLKRLLCGIFNALPKACSVICMLVSLFLHPVCHYGSGKRRQQVPS